MRDLPAASQVSPLRTTSFAEILADPKRPKYLIKGLLYEGEFSVWFGQPKSGKSFLLTDAGLAVARGIEWFGHRVAQGAILHFALEGGGRIHWRFRAYATAHQIEDEALAYYIVREPITLTEGTDVQRIIDLASEHGVVLIIVDTVLRSINDEVDDMPSLVRSVDRIRLETGAHVAVVHHPPVGDGNRPGGKRDLLAGVDTAVKVTKGADGNVFETTDVRDGPDDVKHGFRLRQITLAETDDDGDPITSCVVDPTDQANAPKVKLTDKQQNALDAIINWFIETGRPAMDLDTFKRVMVDKGIAECPDRDRNRLHDLKMQLRRKNVIHINGGSIQLPGMRIDDRRHSD